MNNEKKAVVVAVTGANGLVGSAVCRALAERGASVRAAVRRLGTAPVLDGVVETVGDFTDPGFAAELLAGADAVVSTVHPMGSDRETQERVGVAGTAGLARAAVVAGVGCLVHVSTAAVYDRSPGMGNVDESAALVGDDADDYAVTKRQIDEALAEVDGVTRVLVRPPAILGPGETSVWNTLRPAQLRDDEDARHTVARRTFAWVHVDDLAALIADVAVGSIPSGTDAAAGPVSGECVAVNVAGEPATAGAYVGTVTSALGVDPAWEDGPAWIGQIRTDRAEGWGWAPSVRLEQAMAELAEGLRSAS